MSASFASPTARAKSLPCVFVFTVCAAAWTCASALTLQKSGKETDQESQGSEESVPNDVAWPVSSLAELTRSNVNFYEDEFEEMHSRFCRLVTDGILLLADDDDPEDSSKRFFEFVARALELLSAQEFTRKSRYASDDM